MDRTLFAGLTRLSPDDPLATDGASFLRRNISTIDFFLGLGAVSHRHDAHVGLADPAVAPVVVASASGGTIDPGLVGYFGYTVVDSDGGETLLSPLGSAATPQPFAPPNRAPSGAAEYTGGNLRADTYYYGVTLVDGQGGETTIGPARSVTRDPGYASAQIRLTGLDTLVAESAGALGWAVYRAQNGGQWAFLASGVGSNFVDDGSWCADCLREPPFTNTTRKTTKFVVTLPVVGAGAAIRLYGGSDPVLVDPSLVATYPLASGGAAVSVPSMAFATGQPPPVSTSKGGAHRLDPATEIATASAVLVTPGSGFSSSPGSGWAPLEVSIVAGEVTVAGVVAGSAGAVASGAVIGVVPATFRPKARYAAIAAQINPRGRVEYDVAPDGRIILAEPPTGSAFALNSRWRV